LYSLIAASDPEVISFLLERRDEMKTAGNLLDKKGHNVLSITPDALVYDAI